MTEENASRYVKLTKAQVSGDDEEIKPGELNQAIPTSQVLLFFQSFDCYFPFIFMAFG